MSHARQGSECDGEVEHACHMPDFTELSVVCGTTYMSYACYISDFKKVSVVECTTCMSHVK